ncbi:TPA: PrgH/EprH family type III secretion apparatus protein [Escherichia coli]|nr:PrgH/EprH family type III secretion apparatus protein [Escherichia coli]EFK0006878.1 PrgH/EprH family type III secretion apparatus protein [Escherichia coli]EHH4851108.1 PrgH/EprH family type III secretion apparatus protein [Escherichia coli]EHH7004696.1 PrgH/EprH family type III secretion apparatus protein [Escherichia coli]EHH7147322.1 PrgH/EprH family type III secretion apparatus protein [Escherichia coli]MCV2995088.1 PrgH/EprH family type III secretion apparatus protein [Escherichia col
MENNDKFLSQDLLESYAIRLLSGPLNGCEYEILNGRLLVIIGNDVSLGRSDAFSELPENTIVVPYGELTGSFEIIITTDPDLVVTFRELTAQEPEDRTLTLNQQIEVLGLKFAVKEKNEVWQYSLPGIIENNIISTKQHFFSSKLFKYVMLFFLFAIEQRLEQSLKIMDGIISSRVHVSYDVDNGDSGKTALPIHISVLAVYEKDINPEIKINDIKRFIVNSSASVQYENISVVLSKRRDIIEQAPTYEISEPVFAYDKAMPVSILLALISVATCWLLWKYRAILTNLVRLKIK